MYDGDGDAAGCVAEGLGSLILWMPFWGIHMSKVTFSWVIYVAKMGTEENMFFFFFFFFFFFSVGQGKQQFMGKSEI